MTLRPIVNGLLAVALSGGCAHYAPQPLSDDAVERALLPLDPTTARERVAALHNPLLRAADFDSSRALTPDGAAVLAVIANPTLRAARDQSDVARARWLQAGILPNPSLNFSLDVPIGPNTGGEVFGYGLGIDWEFTALLTRGAKRTAAQAANEQVQLDVAWKEWQVAQGARLATYDVLALRLKQADAQRLADLLNRIAQGASTALQRHDLTAADASAAQAAAHEARVSLVGIRRDLADAELALRRAIGLPADASLSLDDAVALPERLPVMDPANLLANLANRRIDLVALRRGYDSQEATLRAAVLGQFPRIALGISQTRDTGDFLTLGPSISADLPIFDRNQGNIAIEAATRQQLFDEYVARVFEARNDVYRAAARIRWLNEVIEAQQAQVTVLRDLVDADDRALAQGNVDVATFYAAAVSLSQKQADLTALRQDLARTWIDLELATGARLSTSESPAPTTAETTR